MSINQKLCSNWSNDLMLLHHPSNHVNSIQINVLFFLYFEVITMFHWNKKIFKVTTKKNKQLALHIDEITIIWLFREFLMWICIDNYPKKEPHTRCHEKKSVSGIRYYYFSCFSLEKPLTVSWLRDNVITYYKFFAYRKMNCFSFSLIIFIHFSLSFFMFLAVESLCTLPLMCSVFVLFLFFSCVARLLSSFFWIWISVVRRAQGFANEMISQLHVIELKPVELSQAKSYRAIHSIELSPTKPNQTEPKRLIDVRNIVIVYILCAFFRVFVDTQ